MIIKYLLRRRYYVSSDPDSVYLRRGVTCWKGEPQALKNELKVGTWELGSRLRLQLNQNLIVRVLETESVVTL